MRVSVIIPAYNAARWIRRAIESVQAQTVAAHEIIVVDDGSTDGTRELVATMRGVRLFEQANGGPSKARNFGVQRADGELIAFLDSDDWWTPEKIERQTAAFSDPTYVLNYTSMYVVDEDDGSVSTTMAHDPKQLWPRMRCSNPITPSTVMLRRSAFIECGGFAEDLWIGEDWDLWIRLHRLGAFSALNNPLTYYRKSASSLSSDPHRMFRDSKKLVERALVADLSGAKKWLWKRRVLGYQAFKASLTARDAANSAAERNYMLRSFMYWPSPLWPDHRVKCFAVTLAKMLRVRRETRRRAAGSLAKAQA
ncbi:MAG TPA: glycosyltransferase family A protein [Terriglobales bacterium]